MDVAAASGNVPDEAGAAAVAATPSDAELSQNAGEAGQLEAVASDSVARMRASIDEVRVAVPHGSGKDKKGKRFGGPRLSILV